MAVVHAAALLTVVVLAVVLVAAAARWGLVAVPEAPATFPAAPVGVLQSFANASPILRLGLAAGATAWLILGPVALYFALRRD